MSFRLVQNSVTLDDLERRNSPNRSVISSNSVAFGTDYQSCYQGLNLSRPGPGPRLFSQGQGRGQKHETFSRPRLFLKAKAKDIKKFHGQHQDQLSQLP